MNPLKVLMMWVGAVATVSLMVVGIDQYPLVGIPTLILAVALGLNVCRLPCRYVPALAGCEKCEELRNVE